MGISIKEEVSCYASEAQQDVLGIISGIDIIAENFFITGGTALSVFYLHHRASEDIDLFSTEFRDLNITDAILKRTFQNDLTLIQSSSNFYSYLIKEVKVDFVFDPLSIIENRPLVNLSEENSFLSCYNVARKKEALLDDPAMAAYQIEELLDHVLAEKGKRLPLLKKEIDWDSFDKDLRFYVDIIYSMQKW